MAQILPMFLILFLPMAYADTVCVKMGLLGRSESRQEVDITDTI